MLGLHATLLLFVPLFAPNTLLLYPRALLFSGVLQSLSLWMLFLCAMQFRFKEAHSLKISLTAPISREVKRSETMRKLSVYWTGDESGQDVVEYALILALIALGAVASLHSLANVLNNVPSALMQEFWTAYNS